MADGTRTLVADRGDAGRRLDHVLRRHLNGVEAATRTRVQSWIRSGDVLVNGTPVRRVAARTAAGDVVVVRVPEPRPREKMTAEEQAVDVLYEDDHLLAVNKPAGVVVHPTYRHMRGTLMNAVLWRSRDWPPGSAPSIVGRLDKLTSGIVVVAKGRRAHAALQRAMMSRQAEKIYLALVYGRPPARGKIDLPLARDTADRRRVIASGTGSPSLTWYERIARSTTARAPLALLRCRIATGRMHQIRVHLAANGWPVVGDQKYGRAGWEEVADPPLASTLRAFPRQALHATRLTMTHPVTGHQLTIDAPLPDDMTALLVAAHIPIPPLSSHEDTRAHER